MSRSLKKPWILSAAGGGKLRIVTTDVLRHIWNLWHGAPKTYFTKTWTRDACEFSMSGTATGVLQIVPRAPHQTPTSPKPGDRMEASETWNDALHDSFCRLSLLLLRRSAT